MRQNQVISISVILIVLFSLIATISGVTSIVGPGEYEYTSIREENVVIYGKGLYHQMSSDVAIQGIAQDYITLFVAIPMLLASLFLYKRGNPKGLFLLSGTLLYFLVTYLFYTAMAMFNYLFLVYVTLLTLSFFALILSLFSYDFKNIKQMFGSQNIVIRYGGLFLVINSLMVALLWLSIIVPHLIDGSIYPPELQHYTTLIVQGFDLGMLLPVAIVIGLMSFKKNFYGYLFTTIYLIFLTIMMAALTSKILFMANAGQNVIPVIFIMPTVCVISFTFSFLILKNLIIKDK